MSSKNLPPEIDREIAALKGRLTAVEKRLAKRVPDIPGEIVPFSLDGPFHGSSSGAYVHPRGANLVLLVATLVDDRDTVTQVQAKRNGVAVGDPLTIDAGSTIARTKIPTIPFAALYDKLEIHATDAGDDGVVKLVVLAVFDG